MLKRQHLAPLIFLTFVAFTAFIIFWDARTASTSSDDFYLSWPESLLSENHLSGLVPCPPNTPRSRGAWLPVDIVLKTRSYDVDIASPLFASIDLFWPDYASFVLVLDNDAEAFMMPFARPRTRWVKEVVQHPQANGYFGQMWSNMFADVYTTAPVVAIIDSDCALQLHVDRASLTFKNELIVRFLRCPESSNMLKDVHWLNYELWHACMYREGVEHLLKMPYVGNFMVSVPFLVPRSTFAALRSHVERIHGVPFNDVMGTISQTFPSKFSQQTALGVFLYHALRNSTLAPSIGLDGSNAAGGLTGVKFIEWGREEMFPHIGRHLGQEGHQSKSPENRLGYIPKATNVIHRGLCRSYADADPVLCAPANFLARGFTVPGAPDDPDLYFFEINGGGPFHTLSGRYNASIAKICRGRLLSGSS